MRHLELKTKQLQIFLPDADEGQAVLDYFISNQDHLQPTSPRLPKDFFTINYWEKRLNQSLEEFERDQSLRLFFEVNDCPMKITGVVNFTQIVRGPFQACYLGYSIDHQFQGRGLMLEALEKSIQYLFDEKHIHRVMANHLPQNQRSANVLKRLGFRVDGNSPEYLYINGAWQSHVLNSLTNSNWTPRSEDMAIFN